MGKKRSFVSITINQRDDQDIDESSRQDPSDEFDIDSVLIAVTSVCRAAQLIDESQTIGVVPS